MGLLDSVLFLAGVSTFCVKKIQDDAKSKAMGSVSRKQLTSSVMLSETMLGMMRLCIGLLQLSLLGVRINQGPVSTVCNDDVTRCIPYGGIWITSTFTIWCWIIQGVYFTSSGILSLTSWNPPPKVRFAIWVAYEVSLCLAILVFAAVWLVLIPALDRKVATFKGSAEELLALQKRQYGMKHQPFAILVHTANLWFMMLEMSANALPFNWAHFPFVILLGLSYVMFSWIWFSFTGVYYYFFLDCRNWWAVGAYIGLIGSISLFFRFGSFVSFQKHRLLQPLFYASAFLSLSSLMAYYHSTLTRAGILAGDFQAPPSLKQSPLSASSTMGYATETASHLLSTFWAKLGYR